MAVKQLPPPGRLFDEFWREGELALLFGAPGTGKSVLALQIAEHIARGRRMDGFRGTAKRQKVLYVDLQQSDVQFGMRYAGTRAKPYKFSENLYHERPPSDGPFYDWLDEMVRSNGFRVVVIDDLSALRQTYDGTRETLGLMRQLRRLKEELGVSILVLTGAREPRLGGLVSEADMLRSRVLCDSADSVFALGRHPKSPDSLYLIQTRSRSAAIFWNTSNAPIGSPSRGDDGFLSFQFDARFRPEMDEETRGLICRVKSMHDAGATYRMVAEKLGIAKTMAAKLYKKWTPAMQRDGEAFNDAGEVEPDVEDDESPDPDEDYDGLFESEAEPDQDGGLEEDLDIGDMPPEPDDSPRAMLLACGFERSTDKNDREMYVERADESGKPVVSYRFDSDDRLSRWQHDGFGSVGTHVDGPICLFDTS